MEGSYVYTVARREIPGILGAFAKSRTETSSFNICVVLSLRRSAWNISATAEWIFVKFNIGSFY